MKKYLLLFISALVILNSCQKINGTVVNRNGSGAGTATYQPTTTSTTWKYSIKTSGLLGSSTTDTSTLTMATATTLIDSKLFKQAIAIEKGAYATTYYYATNGDYTMIQNVQLSATTSYSIEMLYLKDNVPAGTTWTEAISYLSLGNIALTGTIAEKGVSKTFGYATYSNVIHSTIQLLLTTSGTPTTVVYNVYVAQGIGIVHTDLTVPGSATITQDLISYSIK